MKISIASSFSATLLALLPTLALSQTSAAVPQAEQSDVATLPASDPHRIFTLDSFGEAGIKILDGNTLKIEGLIPTNSTGILALDPSNRFYYVSEAIWTRGNRGTRQDMVSIYDSTTLNLVGEIETPGRLLISARTHIFDISGTGKYAYVYNMQPASSVIVVNLEKRKVLTTVELPGCALAFPFKDAGFSALCGDGSLATVTVSDNGKSKISHSDPFFSADTDPIYEESLVDRTTGKAIFLSYTGKIYPAQLGDKPVIEKPWSLQEGAGMPAAGTGVQELAWRPGGNQMIAWNKAKNRLYVLMHPGTHWTHKEAGTEVWIMDASTHQMIRRIKLPEPSTSVTVSQDAQPLIFVLSRERQITTFNEDTGEKKDTGKSPAGRIAWVPGF